MQKRNGADIQVDLGVEAKKDKKDRRAQLHGIVRRDSCAAELAQNYINEAASLTDPPSH